MKSVRPPGLLVLAVLALHLLLGHEVQRIHEGWLSDGPPPMPERMQVALVREMTLQVPPAVRKEAPPPPPAPRREVAAQGAAEPASAPASAPEPVAPPAAVAEAASTPPPITVAEAASAPVDGEPGPEWPLSTRLSYALNGNYRGPIHGQAQVEWLRKGRDYQVNLDVAVGPSFAPLITRRMSSQGRLTPEGIAPQRYDEETKFILGDPRRISVFFLAGEVQLASGVREPALGGGQDAASQFVQLTWLFLTGREQLQAGRVVQFPLVLPRRQYAWQYEVLGEEALDTPMGRLPTWHLRPGRPATGGDLTAEVWLAPALQYLPVRILIRHDPETSIDLMLKGAPLQAAPESPNDTPRRLSQ
ncbi:DUF3108 domain-containing protein [Pelomonas aquatica]|jgi:hypothetical protein|uniref:DUF3108 domain-containing protein n=1 Tax=Pelomonas aquatica TaxID=431058 RepID=A0A9X4LHV2_9BURK|nr:DUF3108 domain-containing protein [Pelomonas aquatica]MCY4753441.1 DUF3108 domain-containing protein [Pelomonas aquatica]MDG0864331.1 DUF3108 domain-containing protein [Pelomonas aquatica]